MTISKDILSTKRVFLAITPTKVRYVDIATGKPSPGLNYLKIKNCEYLDIRGGLLDGDLVLAIPDTLKVRNDSVSEEQRFDPISMTMYTSGLELTSADIHGKVIIFLHGKFFLCTS